MRNETGLSRFLVAQAQPCIVRWTGHDASGCGRRVRAQYDHRVQSDTDCSIDFRHVFEFVVSARLGLADPESKDQHVFTVSLESLGLRPTRRTQSGHLSRAQGMGDGGPSWRAFHELFWVDSALAPHADAVALIA